MWPPSCPEQLGVGAWHKGGPRTSTGDVSHPFQQPQSKHFSKDRERPPDYRERPCLTLDNMSTQPQGRWLWGPEQVPALLSPSVCSLWGSGHPQDRPGLEGAEAHSLGLHGTLTTPSLKWVQHPGPPPVTCGCP